ncbi:head GIN domain-containing protein [Gilvibacter sediminis]|uniref:head GIN domain-containing protein n=1 Tax=Gilvibacter sediminis TaxID=379071 RepID=UPI00234FF086|nr:head GIN domain-containing protein [Gilvibacter sediminis]MDC7996824.1 DUF2807 domain-containing protein [Gilvibacter sediminis]
MKQIITLIVLVFTSQIFAQEINKEVGDFNTIKVFDLIEVNMIPADENRVVVKGRDVDYVKIINDNGKLKIRMEIDRRFNGDDTFVEVYFKNIETIDANEGSYITVNETLTQDDLELRAQEGGTIKVGLDVKRLKARAVTGGILETSGKTEWQEVTLNTGGIYEGQELITSYTKVTIAAGGEAEIHAKDKAELKVTAGGDIYVYGEPAELKKRTFAGGRIERMY